jgi:Protein of unknown function (DUF3309)
MSKWPRTLCPIPASHRFRNLPYHAILFDMDKTLRLIVIVILILLLIGSLPAWPYSMGWGYYPSGGLGTVLIVLIILLLLGKI